MTTWLLDAVLFVFQVYIFLNHKPKILEHGTPFIFDFIVCSDIF